MERVNQLPTFLRICLHELKVLAELFVLNVFMAGLIWCMAMPYEVGLPVLLLIIIRTKCYDRNISRTAAALPLYLHCTRMTFAGFIFALHYYVLTLHDVKLKPNTFRMKDFNYSHILFELTFVTTIFSLAAIIVRFWLHFALVGGGLWDSIQGIPSTPAPPAVNMGPHGDVPLDPPVQELPRQEEELRAH